MLLLLKTLDAEPPLQNKTCQWALLPWAQITIHALRPECTDSS